MNIMFNARATRLRMTAMRVLLLAGVWSAAAAYGAAPSESSLNLVVNGDFELQLTTADARAVAPFWSWRPENPVKAEVVSSATAHGGQHVLRLTPAAADKAGAVYQPVWLLGQADHYVLQAYARGAPAQFQLQVYEYAGVEKIVETKASEVFPLTDQWARCSLEYRPGPGVKYAAAALHVIKGRAEVDDVQFLPVGDFAKLVQEISAQPWRGNRLGLSRTVPPPFLPMKLLIGDKALTPGEGLARPLEEPFVVTCWGREYHFQGAPLPRQIRSQDADLLAAPATLLLEMSDGSGQASARPIRWGAVTLKELSEDRIVLEGVAEFAGGGGKASLAAALTATIEFDGMVRYDVAVRPGQAVTVDRFALEIPLRRDRAALYHCYSFERDMLFGLTPEGPWHSRWTPVVWLGDHSRGLCWFAESAKGWWPEDNDRQLEIVREPETTTLHVNFINVTMKLSAPAEWTFGLLATPAKPLPSAPRFQHVRTEGFAPPRARHVGVPINYIFIPQAISGEGPDLMEWYLDQTGGVFVENTSEYFDWEKGKTEAKQTVKLAHEQGELLIAWAQERIVPQLPGYIENLAKQMELPMRSDIGTGQGTYIYLCPGSDEWSEELLYGLVQRVKKYEVDGVYFDTGCMYGCTNALHGCGYIDSQGRRQRSFPLFAEREFKKRLYRALYEVMGHPPYISTLVNGNFELPRLTFDTAVISGEEWNGPGRVESDYRRVVTLPQWSVQYYTGQWGFWSIFLPSRSSKMDLASTNSFLAFSLLYNTPLWVAWCDTARVYSALDAIADLGKETAFVPPWEVGRLVQVTPPECKAALYKAKDEALLVLSNLTDNPVPATVACDLAAFGWDRPLRGASDALTGERLSLYENKFEATVPGNGFRLVRLDLVRVD